MLCACVGARPCCPTARTCACACARACLTASRRVSPCWPCSQSRTLSSPSARSRTWPWPRGRCCRCTRSSYRYPMRRARSSSPRLQLPRWARTWARCAASLRRAARRSSSLSASWALVPLSICAHTAAARCAHHRRPLRTPPPPAAHTTAARCAHRRRPLRTPPPPAALTAAARCAHRRRPRTCAARCVHGRTASWCSLALRAMRAERGLF
jgi:hypothetical protein